MIARRLAILFTVTFSFYASAALNTAKPEWNNGDKRCPVASFTDRYIEAPLFHPLQNVAHVDRIPGLNVFADAQSALEGMNLSIYYHLYNGWDPKKKLLIMVPGGPGQPSADMNPLVEIYRKETQLLTEFNVIVMDHRGVGCSRPVFPGNESSESLTMREAASDIDLIRKQLVGENGEISVWGYSYGSLLSQTYALLYPDHLGRMMIGGTVSGQRDWHYGALSFEPLVFSAVDTVKRDAALEIFAANPDIKSTFMKWAFGQMYTYQGRVVDIPKKVDFVLATMKTGDKSTVLKDMESQPFVLPWMMRSISCYEIFPYTKIFEGESDMWTSLMNPCTEYKGLSEYFDYTTLIPQIKAPTMIYAGAFDHVTPANSAIRMSQLIPNSFVFIDKYLGHGHKGKVDCFVKLTDAFFRGVPREELEAMAFSSMCQRAPKLQP